jgi:hypothetical protein
VGGFVIRSSLSPAFGSRSNQTKGAAAINKANPNAIVRRVDMTQIYSIFAEGGNLAPCASGVPARTGGSV